MKLYFSLLLAFISLHLFGQKQELTNEYKNLFYADIYEYKGTSYPLLRIKDIPSSHKLAGLVNDNEPYVDYIYTNYRSVDKKELIKLAEIKDSILRNKKFISLLKQDTLFNKYFYTLVKHYLAQDDKMYIENKFSTTKDTLTFDSLVAISSKFFYLNKISERGCHWAICVGKNGYKNLKSFDGKPLIEAFCFNAIMSNLRNKDYEYYNDYKEGMKLIKEENYKNKEGEPIDLMREEMFKNMSQSESLKKLLKDKYNEMSEKLSFVVI